MESTARIQTITLTDKSGSPMVVTSANFQSFLKDHITLFQMIYETQKRQQISIEGLQEDIELISEELESLENFQYDEKTSQSSEEEPYPYMQYPKLNSQHASYKEPEHQRLTLEGRLNAKFAGVEEKLKFLLSQMMTAEVASQVYAAQIKNPFDKAMGDLGSMKQELKDMISDQISRTMNDELKKRSEQMVLSPERADLPGETSDMQVRLQLSVAEEVAYKQAMNEVSNFSQLPSEVASEEPEMATKEAEPGIPVKGEENSYQALADALIARNRDKKAQKSDHKYDQPRL